jgi:hypothetical protein
VNRFDQLGVHRRCAGPAGAGRPPEGRQPGDALVEACEVVGPGGEPHPHLLNIDALRAHRDTRQRAIRGIEKLVRVGETPQIPGNEPPRVSRRARVRGSVAVSAAAAQAEKASSTRPASSQDSAYAPASSSTTSWRPKCRARSRPAPALAQASSPARRARSA